MMSAVIAVSRLFTRVAAIFLVAMVAINVIDVGLRSGFNAPIFGTYEIVELFLAAVGFLVIPEAFLRNQHITVELIDQVIPPRAVEFLRMSGIAVSVGYLALLAFYMIEPAVEFVELNDVTVDLQYPMIWKGGFVLAGIGFAFFTVLAIFVREIGAALSPGSRA